MCGIAGLIAPNLTGNEAALRAAAAAMADALAHRGPDGWDIWVQSDAGLAFAHRRLAVIDLTPTGAQPMVSADGRWVITYNGEIYNAAEMARAPELAGVRFRGTSDTEVILESVARRGLQRTLADMNGMFALALWDRTDRVLHLVRDRLGIKPLFYSSHRGAVRFGSELKALSAIGPLGSIDPASVASFFRFGYVPTPHAIFSDIRKVRPGEIVSIAGGEERHAAYWSLGEVVAQAEHAAHPESAEQAVEALDALLSDAVARQMISDVPLGAFLSGGIDSSLIVALMTKAAAGRVRSFSIGFPEFGFDESQYAAAVARHLGTEHEELIVTPDEALAVVPQLADIYDEPFADSSQIPTCLVSSLTRKHVTVALSGDGGDELFAGYNRYTFAQRMAARVFMLPRPLRRLAAGSLKAAPYGVLAAAAQLIPPSLRPAQPADKLRKLADLLPGTIDELYLRLVSQYAEPEALAAGAAEHPVVWPEIRSLTVGSLEWMQAVDTLTYLPDDILQKVDRASMACALEVRPPFLDHRVVALAFGLPRSMRMRNGQTKWLLRQVLDRYVPRSLIDRPKMGFGVPLADWLRGPLRGWAGDLLTASGAGGGSVAKPMVQRLWAEHLDGRRNWAYALWTVLMFEAWRRRWATGG
jgi:asparagine synthase (glutamine-hydrolysing)